MSDIPASMRAKAAEDNTSSIDLWLNTSATIRDTIHARALREGEDTVCLEWAVEEVEQSYPWIPEGNERFATAMSALSYGCGVRLWDVAFTDAEGNKVDSRVARKALEDKDTAAQANIYMTWPLLPPEEDRR